jgi:hypothetical protein
MLWPRGADGDVQSHDLYRFSPGLLVAIRGQRRARAHFRAEYTAAACVTSSALPGLEATIGTDGPPGRDTRPTCEPELRGTHKLARWRATLPIQVDAGTLRVAVDVRGPLGLALIQSYVIEPLVSLAAIRTGSVLLPGAAIVQGGETLLLIGRSRSGKSSLAARALAAGIRVLGDDQVLVNAHRECLPFPRRLRLYPDLARTAPAAFARLRPSARRTLAALGRVNAVTRGFVAPPLRVHASALAAGPPETAPPVLTRVVVIRRTQADVVTSEYLEPGELQAEAADVLRRQRAELFSVAGVEPAYASLLEQERSIVSHALTGVCARRVSVPASWPSERAVGALANEIGLPA